MPNSRDRPIAMSRVAGEVEIELERVGQGADPGCDEASGTASLPRAKTRTARSGATPSASTTFLNRPMMKIVSPTARSSAFSAHEPSRA